MTTANSHPALGEYSPSGVFLYADFRDALIVDRDAPELAALRPKKREAMRSIDSEDVLTWNVFRSLRTLDRRLWLMPLVYASFGDLQGVYTRDVKVDLWRTVWPPRGRDTPEGDSEIDVVIECTQWVWFVEAKFRGDVSPRTAHDETRDQIVRNIDVGRAYAGERPFLFSALVLDEATSPNAVRLASTYRDDRELLGQRLTPTTSANSYLGVGVMYWRDLATIFARAVVDAADREQRRTAIRALAYLENKDIPPEPRDTPID